MTGKVKNNHTRKRTSEQSRNRWGWLNTGIVVALVGLIGAVFAAVLPHYLDATPPPRPTLEVDSVAAQSYAMQHPNIANPDLMPGYETLDIKLRNTGNQLAFITGIRVEVKSVTGDGMGGKSGADYVPFSATYGLVISVKKGTFVQPVSEEVAPGQPDRFRLNISLSKDTVPDVYTYQLDLVLVYDNIDSVSAGSMSLDLSPGYRSAS